ncbi:MAG TPA: cytochrome P450, partial [Phototrophicaceae bacterium]|nr:cytochrome P450 [Phototrophicaceae bacterium]
HWRQGDVVNIGQQMSHITRDIVTKTLFNADVSAESQRIGEIIQVLQEMAYREMTSLIVLPDWLPHKRHEQQAMHEIDTIIHRIIAERRVSDNQDQGDLLSMLLLARDDNGQGMTDQEVRDEAMTLFIAGHETTATALTWAWYLIATHPEVEAKLLVEVDALGGKTLTFEDVPKLSYTLQIFKETMRLYPPTWILSRQVAEPTELNGYPIKSGSLVHMFPFVLHRDPRFFDQPLKFDPERFAPGREETITPYAYLPFGGGPRVCIGNSFAMMEVQLLMATILQRYRLTLVPGQGEPELEPLIVLQPKGGIHMQLEPRNSSLIGAQSVLETVSR